MEGQKSTLLIFKNEVIFEATPLWACYLKNLNASSLKDPIRKQLGVYIESVKEAFNSSFMQRILENIESQIDANFKIPNNLLFGLSWTDSINACAFVVSNKIPGVIVNNFTLFVMPLLFRVLTSSRAEDQKLAFSLLLCQLNSEKLNSITIDEKDLLSQVVATPITNTEIVFATMVLEFILLHEIGHVVLNHLEDSGTTALRLDNDDETKLFNYSQGKELDADYFASTQLKAIYECRLDSNKFSSSKKNSSMIFAHLAVCTLFGYLSNKEEGIRQSHPDTITRIKGFLKVWECYNNNVSIDAINLLLPSEKV